MPSVDQLFQSAHAHHLSGRLAEAERGYLQVLAQSPQHPGALTFYGALAIQTARVDLAITLLRKGALVNPRDATLYCNLGEAFRQRGQVDAAIESFNKSNELDPASSITHSNLGIALAQRGDLLPAVPEFERAIQLDPRNAGAHCNFGNVLQLLGRTDEAIDSLQQAIRLQPNYAAALCNLGLAYAAAGESQRAVETCQRAVTLEPRNPDCHWNLANVLLRSGDFERGWREYEWRWELPRNQKDRRFASRPWDGGDLSGKAILLHTEQGFGDALQFVRYVPLVAARGGRVILECQPALARLFGQIKGVEQLIPRGRALPAFDAHCPLLSLPLALGTRLDSIPADIPYLQPNDDTKKVWHDRIRSHAPHARHVGLAWSGNPKQSDDRLRSISLTEYLPLARLSNVILHSVQWGASTAANSAAAREMNLIDHEKEICDFEETAGLMSQLDLVISVDSSPAHLAGAMGLPTLILLAPLADCRYLIDRTDSPWYPTATLVRRGRDEAWSAVIERVFNALAHFSLP